MTNHTVRQKTVEEEDLTKLIVKEKARVRYLNLSKNKPSVNLHMLRVAETRLQELQNELVKLKCLETYEVKQDLMVNPDYRSYNGRHKG